MIRIAIIQFPGSNCERESILAVKRAGMEPVEFLWNESPGKLQDCDGYFLIGGFAYEDRSRAGIIAALDPLMGVIREQSKKGKPVLGVCNGAQVLVEAGLVPGLDGHGLGMALASNRRVKNGHVLGTGYYNAWVNIRLAVAPHRCAFTGDMKPENHFPVPVAHAEGRFMLPEELLTELKKNGQTVFRYCDNTGAVTPEFPVNPNGSADNLAAVCNPEGNVLAMMPHPERTPRADGIFTSMRNRIRDKKRVKARTVGFYPPRLSLSPYDPPGNAREVLVDLIITDHEAVTVESALNQLDIPVTVSRLTHWEIGMETPPAGTFIKEIEETGELFNSNKERVVTWNPDPGAVALLVRYRDDFVGQQKLDVLRHRFQMNSIRHIRKGVLWTLTPRNGDPHDVLERVLQTHILFNPYSHVSFRYR
ncbi:MAG: phosphoribosylformylglycinamidine synthase I [Fidelibacterota bacterium]